MTRTLTTVAFDTLWHNERFYQLTQARFAELLANYTDESTLMARLLEAERRNLGHYGFGIKGFVLSMIETAIEVTDKQVPADVIGRLLEAGQDMLRHPIELLPHARDAVADLAGTHRILLITKGDLLDQERKLAQSGLGDLFDGVEIVSDKTATVYERIFAAQADGPDHAMMVGNSMRSDVLPVVEIGGWGVFVPHGLEWEVEKADPPAAAPRYRKITNLASLPELVRNIG